MMWSNIKSSIFMSVLSLVSAYTHAQHYTLIPAPASLTPAKGYYKTNTKKSLEAQVQYRRGAMPDLGNEGYLLKITPLKIELHATSPAGRLYGMQTLRQLQETTDLPGSIPCVVIKDHPRFRWRGMHLDVSRHFYPVSFIKKYIDFLATYKFNRFHWHLTDDQGWRIEIKKYPELMTKAAYRNGTIVGHHPGTANDNLRYGGFYTQDEIKEVVAYAAARAITVVPEIEMPGHASAAIAAYPWLSCFPEQASTGLPEHQSAVTTAMLEQGQKKFVQETWGVFDDIFCAGKDSTFLFLQNVMDEILPLFPSTYIHIGGDEAPKTHWEKCPACKARMQKENLQDAHELQSYFIRRMEKYLSAKGRTMIGWDEILEGGLAPNAVVMSWRGEAGGIEAAKLGHDAIMTPGKPLYFDHLQGKEQSEPLSIGGLNTLEMVYKYEPLPKAVDENLSTHLLGAQANLWTEYIPTTQHVEYMVLPRMLALSEVLWSDSAQKNWDDFTKRLQQHFKNFARKGWNYRANE